MLSFIGFWSKETWAPRFLFFIIVSFLSGMYFPLDIVPRAIYNILILTPFPYLLFIPLKIYLGQVDLNFILRGLLLSLFWIYLLNIFMKNLWNKGLKIYTSEGI